VAGAPNYRLVRGTEPLVAAAPFSVTVVPAELIK